LKRVYTKVTKKFLEQEYLGNKKTIQKIANKIGCSYTYICNRMIEFNIDRRSFKELTQGKNNPFFGKHHTEESKRKRALNMPDQSGINNPMFNKYHSEEAKEKIRQKAIGRKHTNETKKRMSLSHGGTGIKKDDDYPYEYFKIRNKILKRDNYICQLCLEYGNEVHHIDYDKDNNEEWNLCCSCIKCNRKVNYNREYWKNYFQSKSKVLI